MEVITVALTRGDEPVLTEDITGLDGGREKGETGLMYLGLEGGVAGGGVAEGVLLPAGVVAGLGGRCERGGSVPDEVSLQNKDSVWLNGCILRHQAQLKVHVLPRHASWSR
jgi:hypothetical protein